MKLICALFILCFITPSLAYFIPHSSGFEPRLPRRLRATPKPKPIVPYQLTDADKQVVQDCFAMEYLRTWQHQNESALNQTEAFCRRIAKFKPPENESIEALANSPDRFAHLTIEWTKWAQESFYQEIIPSAGEKQEMEDCYFHRAWQRCKDDSKLSSHEALCKRLSAFEVNAADTNRMLVEGAYDPFIEYHNQWNAIPEISFKDYKQVLECAPFDQKTLQEKMASPCKHYYEILPKPETWRDIRRKKLHDCMKPKNQNGKRKNRCKNLIVNLKKKFYSKKPLGKNQVMIVFDHTGPRH